MHLPPIKIKINHMPSNSSRKFEEDLRRPINSKEQICSQRIRTITESQSSYISKKLMNYLEFAKVKQSRNPTQQCQQQLQKYDNLKHSLKSLHHDTLDHTSSLNQLKISFSLRKKSTKLKINSSKSNLKRQSQKYSVDRLSSKLRVKTEVDSGRRHKSPEFTQADQPIQLNKKKYAQLSIREIVEKDNDEYLQNYKKVIFMKTKEHLRTENKHVKTQTFEGW